MATPQERLVCYGPASPADVTATLILTWQEAVIAAAAHV